MIINALYDSSSNYAPSGYKTAIASAISYLDTTFTNNVTINIHFGWGEVDGQSMDPGAIGENLSNGNLYSYAQVRSGLIGAATSATDAASIASLPSTDPTHGGQFWLTDAQATTLHLANFSDIEAWVGLSNLDPYTFDPNHRAVPGSYDAIGVIEHEITEVMGRIGFLGQYAGSGSSNTYGPIDLFRYSAPGVRDFNGNGYFSADGTTMQTKFNDPRYGGDVADWTPSLQGDSFGDAYAGTADSISATDLKVMDVLGYTIGSPGQASNIATTANQTFYSTAANESFTGGVGIDTVVYQGQRSQYTVADNSGTITVSDSVASRDGTDTLHSIQQVKFSDVTLVYDLQSSQDKLVYLTYQAAFARMPDVTGFRYWSGVADSTNASALSLADGFLASPEFAVKYGNPNTQTFVTELYSNVLGRTPDQSGLSYWVDQANTGIARDQLLVDFATSAENVQLTGTHTSNGDWVT